MRTVINNGTFIDPKNKIFSKLNIAIEKGKIRELSMHPLKGDKEIDAEGLIVSPGFVDIHMHEDPYNAKKDEFEICIFESMIKMGVTTAIGGNCGIGPENPDIYMDAVQRLGLPLNFGLLLPHEILRKKAGENDKYEASSNENILKMKNLADFYLGEGCLGISFGIRYIPGISEEELNQIGMAAQKHNKLVTAHIRDDAANVLEAAMELIGIGEKFKIPVQISHIGSMGAFGQMDQLLSLIDYYKANGLDICADCYPYNAFSTRIGETTYDDGFLERYNTSYESIEISEGKYRGKRCTEEIFKELRANDPRVITVAHVMNKEEVDRAVAHPNVVIASDGLISNSQGHPRASGTFPRVISEYVRNRKILTLYQAIEKMTYLPSKRFGLDKGALGIGDDADIVIFNYEEIADRATFENPMAPPDGIKYVFVNGELTVKDNELLNITSGKMIR